METDKEIGCQTCRFSLKGVCLIPLYVDGEFYPGRDIKDDGNCYLYEGKNE